MALYFILIFHFLQYKAHMLHNNNNDDDDDDNNNNCSPVAPFTRIVSRILGTASSASFRRYQQRNCCQTEGMFVSLASRA